MIARWWMAAFLCCSTCAAVAQSAAWYQSDFPAEEFQARWARIHEKIGNDAEAIVAGMPLTAGFMMPRQANEFYYLSGIETPNAYILLDGRRRQTTLFLPPRNARLESAEGRVLSAEDAEEVKRLTGVNEVLSTEAMRGDWLGRPPGGPPRQIYTPFSPAEGAEQNRGVGQKQALTTAVSFSSVNRRGAPSCYDSGGERTVCR